MTMQSKKLYRVVVAISEKRNDAGEIEREFKVVYDGHEQTTASEVKPVNIIRRPKMAEELGGIPAEEVQISVSEVALGFPFR
jgi:hypothetical protein